MSQCLVLVLNFFSRRFLFLLLGGFCYFSSTTGVHIDCLELDESNADPCTVLKLSVPTAETELTTVDHGSNTSAYEVITFKDTNIKFVPKGICKMFPALYTLRIHGSLHDVNKPDLAQCPDLTYLDFYGNQIEVLPLDLFEGSLKLEIIVLANNPLKHIAQDIFANLEKLRIAILLESECIDAVGYSREQIASEVIPLFKNCTETAQMRLDYGARKLSEIDKNEKNKKIIEALDVNFVKQLNVEVSQLKNNLASASNLAADSQREVEDQNIKVVEAET
jgi:Leucine-rich repeat (LRR) protein